MTITFNRTVYVLQNRTTLFVDNILITLNAGGSFWQR